MIFEAISLGLMVADWAYHRWWDDRPEVKPAERRFRVQRVDNGAPVGMFYGRCRVRQPVVSWLDNVAYDADSIGGIGNSYQLKILFTLGLPFYGGTNTVHGMWIGDQKDTVWQLISGVVGSTQTGDGAFEDVIEIECG